MQWIDFELSKASKVAMRFTFPRVENPFLVNGPLHVRVSDLAGQLVLDDYVGGASGPGRFDLRTGLLPGKYRVKVRSVWNAHPIASCIRSCPTTQFPQISRMYLLYN
mgnify:CR=1 FL=1